MSDVFPRRNLPEDAEEWGRTVESFIVSLENGSTVAQQNISGQNRTTAATMGDLVAQAQEITRLYRAIPKPAQRSVTNTGMGLSSGWNTVASVDLTVPLAGSGFNLLAIASGQFYSNTSSTNVEVYGRLVCGGDASPEIYGLWSPSSGSTTWLNTVSTSYTWSGSATSSNLSVSFQVRPVDPASWPGGLGSFASLSVTATFQ